MNNKIRDDLINAYESENNEQIEAHLDSIDDAVKTSKVVDRFLDMVEESPNLLMSIAAHAASHYEDMVERSRHLQKKKEELGITDPGPDLDIFCDSPHFRPVLTIAINTALALMEAENE